jgi:hypothetical protein
VCSFFDHSRHLAGIESCLSFLCSDLSVLKVDVVSQPISDMDRSAETKIADVERPAFAAVGL